MGFVRLFFFSVDIFSVWSSIERGICVVAHCEDIETSYMLVDTTGISCTIEEAAVRQI